MSVLLANLVTYMQFSFRTMSRPLHSQRVSPTYSSGGLGKRLHAGPAWALQFNTTMGIPTIQHGT